MRRIAMLTVAGLALTFGQSANAVTFSSFVSSSDINAAEGQNATIAFTYAGNKFVGSVYNGVNNNQLYSTDLTGHNVQQFGGPIPGAAGEVVVAAGLGQGGFPKGDIYAGSQNSNQIYTIPNAGGAPVLFATTPNAEGIRQILFDPGSSFGGKMLVTTDGGNIYTVTSSGTVTPLASVGEDVEGMDIASSKYGKYAGQLLVASENSGRIRAISPTGTVTVLQSSSGGDLLIPQAETVSVVPQTSSGNPLEGFYVANYAVDVQFASLLQFAGLGGDAIVTSEFPSSSAVWDLTYNGDLADTFDASQIGTLPNQSEDGIFVTAERIHDITTPEPASLTLLGLSLTAMGAIRRRKTRR